MTEHSSPIGVRIATYPRPARSPSIWVTSTGWHQLSFGPSNTAVHEVAVSVELGDGAAGIGRSRALQLPADMPRIRFGQHFLDLARARLWEGDRAGALHSLAAARHQAPHRARRPRRPARPAKTSAPSCGPAEKAQRCAATGPPVSRTGKLQHARHGA